MGGNTLVINMNAQVNLSERIRRTGVIISAKNYDHAEIEDAGEPGVLELDYRFYERRYRVRFIVKKNGVKVERCVLEPDGTMRGGDIDISLDEFNEVLRILQEDINESVKYGDVTTLCGDVKGLISHYS
jgi:hypothetical protein